MIHCFGNNIVHFNNPRGFLPVRECGGTRRGRAEARMRCKNVEVLNHPRGREGFFVQGKSIARSVCVRARARYAVCDSRAGATWAHLGPPPSPILQFVRRFAGIGTLVDCEGARTPGRAGSWCKLRRQRTRPEVHLCVVGQKRVEKKSKINGRCSGPCFMNTP